MFSEALTVDRSRYWLCKNTLRAGTATFWPYLAVVGDFHKCGETLRGVAIELVRRHRAVTRILHGRGGGIPGFFSFACGELTIYSYGTLSSFMNPIPHTFSSFTLNLWCIGQKYRQKNWSIIWTLEPWYNQNSNHKFSQSEFIVHAYDD